MKTRSNDFSGASALQIMLGALAMSVVAISFASLFAAARSGNPEPAAPGPEVQRGFPPMGNTGNSSADFNFGLDPASTPTPTPSIVCGTFANPAPIIIPFSSGISSPYPSNLTVSGLGGAITKVTVGINGLNTAPAGIDALLIGPGGQSAIIMSDAGANFSVTGVNLVLDDTAANPLPNGPQLVSGTYQPTNIGECVFNGTLFSAIDEFPAPAPTPSGSSTLSVFNGTNPNGTWNLYVFNDGGGTGNFSGGWSVTISTNNCAGPTATPRPTPTPGGTTHFAVVAPPSCANGSPCIFTVTALDEANNTVTSYPGTVHFTSSDRFGPQLPGDSQLVNGSGTFGAGLNNLFGHDSITATDTSDRSITGTSNCILVLPSVPPTPSPTPTPTATPSPVPPTPTPTPGDSCPPVITHSSSQTITPGSASCNGGTPNFFHTDNSYWRAFDMATFTGGASYNVTSVSFGIENAVANPAAGFQPVTVRLYTQTAGTFPGGSRTQVATTTVNVTDQMATVLTVPLLATVPTGTSELIMEVFTPNGQAPVNNSFFIGSNAAAQTGPSYISATTCGIPNPTDVLAIGFPNMHIVFNIIGACPEPTPPGPTPTPTPAPTCTSFEEVIHLCQNFDYTVPPALPSNWTSSFVTGAADCTGQGTCASGSDWVTSTSNPYTGPASAFHDAPGCVTDSYLYVPSFYVPTYSNLGQVHVGFQHSFNLENGRDGGVLEVSYDGGCFSDIRAIGGSASYNGTISTGFQSPIAGRDAWTGNSGGYIAGSAGLPASAKGHTVTLRFRLATDCGGSGTGWSIDVVEIQASFSPPGTPAPTPIPTPSPSPFPPVCSLAEGFNVVGALTSSGWVKQNNSGQFRFTDWSNGDTSQFPAQTGAPNSYVAVSFSVGCGTISNWLLTPPITLANGGTLTFWTRTVDSPVRPDRLQVRMSTSGTSSNVGYTPTDIGDFTALLLDINPTYTTSGYPNVWTQYTLVMSGLASPIIGRLAFRYFVENGGPNGINSDYVGIDTVSYACGVSTPTPTATATPCEFGGPPGACWGPPTPPPPTPTPTPGGVAHAVNLSTRLLVLTGDNFGIGGFIITGTDPKQVLIRGIGPSLGGFGVPNPLADPVLELHGPGTFVTITNNNWKESQESEINATGIAPTNDLESAILVTLDPGAYTAILSGNNNGTGVGLVEIYDLSQGNSSKLANISTRGFASTGNDIVIAGFILGGGSGDDFIVVRGIGPSLTNFGVHNALANPTLELRNGEGALVVSNDDWQSVPPGPPVSLPPGLAPTDALESAIAALLPPGAYTALLSGVNNGTGVGLVEVYDLGALP